MLIYLLLFHLALVGYESCFWIFCSQLRKFFLHLKKAIYTRLPSEDPWCIPWSTKNHFSKKKLEHVQEIFILMKKIYTHTCTQQGENFFSTNFTVSWMQLKHATCIFTIICDMCRLEYASTYLFSLYFALFFLSSVTILIVFAMFSRFTAILI